MPRQSSPYKQVLNKNKEPVFYEIKEFILYLMGEKMLSANTAQSYETDLNKYCEYLKKYRNIYDVIDITKEDIESYLLTLKKNGFTASSIARKLTSIKKFHAFCVQEYREIKDDPAKLISASKKEVHLPEVLSIEEIELYAHDHYIPIARKQTVKFMVDLVKENNYKSFLEIGTAIGYTSIVLAKTFNDINIIRIVELFIVSL